tara:strand:+ start:366 stop:536 length:171 start_codon:yes stop_codon:yes gene_type:complete
MFVKYIQSFQTNAGDRTGRRWSKKDNIQMISLLVNLGWQRLSEHDAEMDWYTYTRK